MNKFIKNIVEAFDFNQIKIDKKTIICKAFNLLRSNLFFVGSPLFYDRNKGLNIDGTGTYIAICVIPPGILDEYGRYMALDDLCTIGKRGLNYKTIAFFPDNEVTPKVPLKKYKTCESCFLLEQTIDGKLEYKKDIDGEYNTDILLGISNNFKAAAACKNYKFNIFYDKILKNGNTTRKMENITLKKWYLPSAGELVIAREYVKNLNTSLYINNIQKYKYDKILTFHEFSKFELDHFLRLWHLSSTLWSNTTVLTCGLAGRYNVINILFFLKDGYMIRPFIKFK